jgi:hypothetical protein
MPSVAATAAMLRIPPGGERVRGHVRNDVDLGHRQAGSLRKAPRHLMERMLRTDLVARYIRSTSLSENQ